MLCHRTVLLLCSLSPPLSWLDEGVAREAARGWGMVVKEAANLPIVFWFLHMAACESRLFVHAGRPVGFDPSSPLENGKIQEGVNLVFGPGQKTEPKNEGILACTILSCTDKATDQDGCLQLTGDRLVSLFSLLQLLPRLV